MMDRHSFELWGIELTDEEFARALAALGVLQPSQGWPLGQDVDVITGYLHSAIESHQRDDRLIVDWSVEPPLPAHFAVTPRTTPARTLADAWERFISQYKKMEEGRLVNRLQIQIDNRIVSNPYRGQTGSDPFWVVEQLARPEVGAASVFFLNRLSKGYQVKWNWPLAVGFLPDPASQELREDLERFCEELEQRYGHAPHVKRLTRFVNLSSSNDTCDLLLLPHDLHTALATVLQLPWQARADCVIVLGRVKGQQENALMLMATLRSHIHTAGIALAYVARKKRADWFDGLITELSHNNSLDCALFSGCRAIQARPPLLAATRQLVEFSLVSKRLESLKDKFRREAARNLKITLSEPTAYRLGLPEGEHDLGTVGDQLDLKINRGDLSYDNESDTASTTAELESASRAALENLPRPVPEARWIQAKVFDLDNAREPQQLRRACRANAPHAVVIRIGVRSEEWLAPDARSPDASFPAHELPAEETSHNLTVIFSEPNLLSEPLVETLVLPRHGDSSECRFLIHTKEAKQLEARVIVLHKNRVLQTALLCAPVAAEPVEAAGNSRIELSIEAVVRPGFQALDSRRKFDAALVLNHDGEHVAGATAATEDGAAYIRLPNLDKAIKGFDDKLSEIAKDPDSYAGLSETATVDLLRGFAQNGSQLYRRIIKDGRVGDTIARAGRIQIITAVPEARLPIEFFYDREAPDDNVPLCQHASEALLTGKCSGDCPTGLRQRTVVCPLGFWGLNRVIERYAHNPEANSPVPDGKDLGLRAEPIGNRKYLQVLTSALLGASSRVDEVRDNGVATVAAEMRNHIALSESVTTWPKWLEEIEGKKPSLLLLLVHTEVADFDQPQMEIGQGEFLKAALLRPEHVRDPNSNSLPLVLLLGCDTGAPDINVYNFVSEFRDRGAAIVVSTGATILGEHAVDVAIEFLKVLAKLCAMQDVSFGDAMLMARRELLEAGLPMVLCLMSYGDADWQIGQAQN